MSNVVRVTQHYVNSVLNRERSERVRVFLDKKLGNRDKFWLRVPFEIVLNKDIHQYKIVTRLLSPLPMYFYEDIESFMGKNGFKNTYTNKVYFSDAEILFKGITFEFECEESGNSVFHSYTSVKGNDPNGHSYKATGTFRLCNINDPVCERVAGQLADYFSARSFNLGRDVRDFKRIIKGVMYKYAVGEFDLSTEINFSEVDSHLSSKNN